MNTKAMLIAAAVLVPPPAALVGWTYFSKPAANDVSFLQMMGQLGYHKLDVPSRLNGPGTLITVETRSDRSVHLLPLCTMKQKELASFWQTSPTVDMSVTRGVETAFGLRENTLNSAAAQATGNRVQRVTVSLQNMRVVTISQEDLLNVRNTLMTGSCEQAMKANLRAGAKVCQTVEMLEADVAYRASFAGRIGTSEQAELAKTVNATVNLSLNQSGTNETSGKDLYFGVRMDLGCVMLTDPEIAARS